MKQNFSQIMTWALRSEGGYVDNIHDRGGATNRGVTLAVLEAWRKKPVSKQDVRDLSLSEALAIYHALYWQPIKGDTLPSGVDYCMMDAAINSGVSRSIKFLQKALHLTQTGRMDLATVSALARVTDKIALVNSYDAARLGFMRSLSVWRVFGKGWSSRVATVTRLSTVLATHVH